jgi:hypothetical protein
MLFATHFKVTTAVVGAYPTRVTGAIAADTPGKAFEAIVSGPRTDASLAVTNDRNAWMIAPKADLARLRGRTPKVPEGCNKRIGATLQRVAFENVLDLLGQANGFASDQAKASSFTMTVFGSDVDFCRVATTAAEIAGESLEVTGKKLVQRGDGGLSTPPDFHPVDKRECPHPRQLPNSALKATCWPIADLVVVGLVGSSNMLAVVRPRSGRTEFAAGDLVWKVHYIGNEEAKIESIDKAGIHLEGGKIIPPALAPP